MSSETLPDRYRKIWLHLCGDEWRCSFSLSHCILSRSLAKIVFKFSETILLRGCCAAGLHCSDVALPFTAAEVACCNNSRVETLYFRNLSFVPLSFGSPESVSTYMMT
ncbi:hypothetical protein NPIL_695981 [Nephila pilipes]|uniref:Uncharacterized protein n=1 Tax=Nephila pilipes TaxID=299642 RepID=A0A8X6PJ48_NEPPI|nr:hypothetical protein NPIL_695981 [Nephila pilipes]